MAVSTRAPAILDHLASLADTTRSRLLLLLDRHELTVSELCGIMQLPQSTVSRHLKALADSGWVSARADGTSHLYTMTRDELDAPARRLWSLVRDQVGPSPAGSHDERRLQATLADRRTKSQEFFSSSAGQWDRLRDELYGERFHLGALAALAQGDWVLGDLGCGTGETSATLAPFVSHIIAVDTSAAMLQAARKRLQPFDNVDLRRGDLEALPIDDARLDAATLMLVLHYVPEPDTRAGRSVAGPQAGRPADHGRHAAARPRQLSPADGPCLAGIFGGEDDPAVGRRRIRKDTCCSAGARRAREGTWLVCRDW